MSRPVSKQLQTQYWLLAMFNARLDQDDLPDEDRATTEAGRAATEQRIRDLGGSLNADDIKEMTP